MARRRGGRRPDGNRKKGTTPDAKRPKTRQMLFAKEPSGKRRIINRAEFDARRAAGLPIAVAQIGLGLAATRAAVSLI